MAVLDVPGTDLDSLRATLDRHEVRHRTIVATRGQLGRHRVLVYDEGRNLRANLTAVGRIYRVRVSWTAGVGTYVGAESQAGAPHTYERLIRDDEGEPARPRCRP